jgi:hypothetical protein
MAREYWILAKENGHESLWHRKETAESQAKLFGGKVIHVREVVDASGRVGCLGMPISRHVWEAADAASKQPDHAAALDGQPEESKETPVWMPNMVESIHADADRLGKKMGAPKTDAEQPDHAAALADAAEKLMGLMCMDSQDFDMPIGQAYDSLYRKITAYRASQKGGA